MDWLLAMAYGAIGGAVVEAVVSSDRVLAWNAARHQALGHQPADPVPALTAYVDPLSDVAAGLTRILLGAVAGLLFHSQVTGAYAAIAVGCSAPTVLRQLGSARLGAGFELESGPPMPEHAPASEHGSMRDHGLVSGQGSVPEHGPAAAHTTEPHPPKPQLADPTTTQEPA